MVPSDSEDEIFGGQDGPQTTNIPPTIYVIKFHPNTRRDAVEWLLEKIEAKQKYGGAELFVRCEPQKHGEGVTVHISATKIKLLEVAESIDLQKRTANGLVQDFSVRDLDQFLYGGQSLDTVLTPSEREFCVRHELDGIRARTDEPHVCGYNDIRLFPGQSILDVYQKEELVTDFFPSHDRTQLEDLGKRWYKSIFHGASLDIPFSSLFMFVPILKGYFKRREEAKAQKFMWSKGDFIEEIRSYFGESVAMYFSFLGFYTLCLLAPAMLGVAQMFLSVDSLSEYAFFAAFNLVWVTVFLELWKRRSAELAYKWGTLNRTSPPEPRPNYRGEMQQNPITGRYEPYEHPWIAKAKLYCISMSVVGGCMLLALYVMIVGFYCEEQLIDWKKQYGSILGLFSHIPSAIYAAVVWIMNYYYRIIANILTEWENHRTVEDHEWHRVSKLVVFEFVNNFSSLFYIAFYINDMDMLCSQVATMLIVTQMINHFREALLPFVVKKAYKQFSDAFVKELSSNPVTATFFHKCIKPVHTCTPEEMPIPVLALDPKDPRIEQAKEEAILDPYKDAYDDYLEMFLQFGYVFLFSSVYPMAAFWATLNNVLELKTDAFKLCRVYQRPKSKKVANIGVWQSAFELMGAIAVMTNCALLCQSPRIRTVAPALTTIEWVLIFVAFEHIVLAIKMALVWCVNDQPQWIREALDKVNFQAKMALRNERGKKTRRHLSRRFRSVHGVPRSGSRSRATTPINQNGGVRNRMPYAKGDYRD